MKLLTTFFLLFSLSAFAQIQITSSDITSIYSPGNSTPAFNDTTTNTIDIGTPGGGNQWDFSGLQAVQGLQINVTMEDPSQTPYFNDFSDAGFAQHIHATITNANADIYNYYKLNSNFLSLGSVSVVDTLPGFDVKVTNNPPETTAELPLTFNTNWSDNFVVTTVVELNGITIITDTSIITSNVVVDAYGTMTLPGGGTYEALRLRDDQIEVSDQDYNRTISYQFISKSGAQISFDADTTQPNSGVITVNGDIVWSNNLVSGVDEEKQIPGKYILNQNYPNPFNPSTIIEYSIPQESFVELKVYDVLGKEVATLVNKEQPQGTYKVAFDAEALPSGLYLAKMRANNFSKVIKMTLLK